MSTKPELGIEPGRFRRAFLIALVAGLLLVWSAWFSSLYYIRKGEEEQLHSRIQGMALLLEDHATRTLDSVSARLKSVSAFTSPAALREGRLSVEALGELIYADRVVRSLSLLDDQGRVVASSRAQDIGVRLAPEMLAGPGSRPQTGEIRYGAVLPARDLDDIGVRSDGSHATLWLAAMGVRMGDAQWQWVAVINPGLFENFWLRLEQDKGIGVAMYNYQGEPVATWQPVARGNESIVPDLMRAMEDRARGVFDAGSRRQLMVAYRASESHPVILTVGADRGLLRGLLAEDRQRMAAIAAGVSLFLVVLVGFLFRWYLRYEAAVIEVANQGRAISAHLMVSETALDGKIIRVNRAFLDVTGYNRDEVVGQSHRMLSSGLHPREFYEALWQTIRAGKIWKGTLRDVNKAGEHFWVNATIIPYTDAWGKVTHFVGFYSDITESIAINEQFRHERQLREELAHINSELVTDVNTDPLTGVPNRRAFDSFLAQTLISVRDNDEPVSLLMLDIDMFKLVNDTWGHPAGDEVLRTLAQLWAAQLRTSDMLARLGGEEFCIVLPQTGYPDAGHVADKIREVTAQHTVDLAQLDVTAVRVCVTVSIGLAWAGRSQCIDARQLVAVADEALYEAKKSGRNRVVSRRVDAPAG